MATSRARNALLWTGGVLTVLTALFVAFGGIGIIKWAIDSQRMPPALFSQTTPPPAPDFAEGLTWLAYPGRNGLERSVPRGLSAVNETNAQADVFFIHPTTYTERDVWNAAYDADLPVANSVLLGQLSVFNGCCRLYAPHYRQATGPGLDTPQALDIAYDDISRAFQYYMANENRGRPFIIAGHSQGAYFASRLLQQEILNSAANKQLVAAYAVGAYIPEAIVQLGMPICDTAKSIGCLAAWNTVKTGKTGPRDILRQSNHWWKGANHKNGSTSPVD